MLNARHMLITLVCLCLISRQAIPQKSKGVLVWSSALSHVAETQVPWDELESDDNHTVAVSYLRDDTAVESHASLTEILVARDGDATLVIYDRNRSTNASIANQIHLSKGDVVEIPPNWNHQLKIAPGQFFVYTSIRINSH